MIDIAKHTYHVIYEEDGLLWSHIREENLPGITNQVKAMVTNMVAGEMASRVTQKAIPTNLIPEPNQQFELRVVILSPEELDQYVEERINEHISKRDPEKRSEYD